MRVILETKVSPERLSSVLGGRTELDCASCGITRGILAACCISISSEGSTSRSSRGVGAEGPRIEVSPATLMDHRLWSSSYGRCLFSSQKISFSIDIALRTVEKLEEVSITASARFVDCCWPTRLEGQVQLYVDQRALQEMDHVNIRINFTLDSQCVF